MDTYQAGVLEEPCIESKVKKRREIKLWRRWRLNVIMYWKVGAISDWSVGETISPSCCTVLDTVFHLPEEEKLRIVFLALNLI